MSRVEIHRIKEKMCLWPPFSNSAALSILPINYSKTGKLYPQNSTYFSLYIISSLKKVNFEAVLYYRFSLSWIPRQSTQMKGSKLLWRGARNSNDKALKTKSPHPSDKVPKKASPTNKFSLYIARETFHLTAKLTPYKRYSVTTAYWRNFVFAAPQIQLLYILLHYLPSTPHQGNQPAPLWPFAFHKKSWAYAHHQLQWAFGSQ